MPLYPEERWWSDETEELMERLGIDDEDKPFYAQYLCQLGLEAYEEGNSEALKTLYEIFSEAGYVDKAAEFLEDYLESIGFYEKILNYTGYYDERVGRWRDVVTGRFIQDPYKWLWGAEI